MKCSKFKTYLSEYLDATLSETDKENLKVHLSECSFCADELRNLKKIKTFLSSLDKQHAPDDFASKVSYKIKNNIRIINPLESFIAAAKMSLAATVFIFAITAAFSLFAPSIPQNTNIDNVEAINSYVLKGNSFTPQKKISDAQIMEALLG